MPVIINVQLYFPSVSESILKLPTYTTHIFNACVENSYQFAAIAGGKKK